MVHADSTSVRAGNYAGVQHGGAVAWRGVPYAHAPRFGLARPVKGPSEVTLFERSAEALVQEKVFGASAGVGEGLLTLDIYSPGADQAARPVMVFIHGGAFSLGRAGEYDGAQFAKNGDVVVVNINYRLGVLGFSDLSTAGVPRNLGILDQVCALEWVADNVAAFGGDPSRVTVVGESAGSLSISLLMLSPRARGLFHGAIMQSGALNLCHESDLAASLGARVLQLLDPGRRGLDHLRSLPSTRVLQAQRQLTREHPKILSTAPIFDGELLPASLAEAVTAPTAEVRLLAGSNRDEIRLFELPGLPDVLPRRRSDLVAVLRAQLGAEQAAAIEGLYPAGRAGDRELATDVSFTMPTRHFARRHAEAGNEVWTYRFDMSGPLLGAPHAADLAYLWPMATPMGFVLRGGPMVADRRRLAQRMQRSWLSFVSTGDPGSSWARYSAPGWPVHLLGRHDQSVEGLDEAKEAAWRGADVLTSATVATTSWEMAPHK